FLIPVMHPLLKQAKRVVVKIGSPLLVEADGGRVRQPWFSTLIADVAALRQAGKDVIIVSSGAVALGRRQVKLKGRPNNLKESQAAAAVVQIRSAHGYESALGRHGITAAQVVVSPGDTEDRRRYLNARNT